MYTVANNKELTLPQAKQEMSANTGYCPLISHALMYADRQLDRCMHTQARHAVLFSHTGGFPHWRWVLSQPSALPSYPGLQMHREASSDSMGLFLKSPQEAITSCQSPSLETEGQPQTQQSAPFIWPKPFYIILNCFWFFSLCLRYGRASAGLVSLCCSLKLAVQIIVNPPKSGCTTRKLLQFLFSQFSLANS